MDKKLKVLCLHGGQQNADYFKRKIGSFRKNLKKYVEFGFINAPHRVPIDAQRALPGDEANIQDQFIWWTATENVSPNCRESFDEVKYVGFEESLKHVEEAMLEEPFDGLMGFSQGAAFVALVCTLYQKKLFKADFRFVILIAGFKSRCSSHQDLYTDPIQMPSLHVIGKSDLVIKEEKSNELRSVFINSVTLSHPGGHFVPASSAERQTYISFIENQILK